MTRAQVIPVIVFFGAIFLLIAGMICYDAWLAMTAPNNVNMISWGMAILGHAYPVVAMFWGMLCMIPIGLGVHFFVNMMSPSTWKQLQLLQWQITTLRARGVIIPEPAPDTDLWEN